MSTKALYHSIAILALSGLLFPLFFIPFEKQADRSPRYSAGFSDLKHIGLAMHLYSEAYGNYPVNLADLYPAYLSWPRLERETAEDADAAEEEGEWGQPGLIYLGQGGNLSPGELPSDFPLIIYPFPHHNDNEFGYSVFFNDGHLEVMDPSEFHALMWGAQKRRR